MLRKKERQAVGMGKCIAVPILIGLFVSYLYTAIAEEL